MSKYFLTLLLGLTTVFFISAQDAAVDLKDPRLAGLNEELDSILPNFKAVGFSVAVVEKDKVIYSKGFGYRDMENKKPASANTLFAIGSSTKAFTSSLLGLLRKDGKVDFTESPRTYVPYLNFHNDKMNNGIQVKDIMCHRTGLPRHDISWYMFPSKSEKELVERIQYQEPTAENREVWQYNNFMFLLQGQIAAEINKEPWHATVKSEILGPLGMERTNFSIPAMEADEEASLGYEVNADQEIEKMDYYKIRAMGAAGSINSSANEMARWVQVWINGGKYGEEEILPAAYVSEAMSPQMLLSGGLPSAAHPDVHIGAYGYGWFISSYRSHYRVEHGGNIDGFSASVAFFPTDSVGIVVLVNQNGSPVTRVVRNIIADRMLGLEKENWHLETKQSIEKAIAQAEAAAENTEEVEKIETAHQLEDFTGTYKHPGYGSLKVVLEDGKLFAEMPELRFWLKHSTYDIFHPILEEQMDDEDAAALAGLYMSFTTDPTGKVNAVMIPLEGGLDPMEFTRQIEEKEMSKEELAKYEGEYELAPGVVAKFYTKEESTLYAFIQGQPEYELVATGKHTFALKILDGYSTEFVEESDGSISAVKFIQPNGIFKATKK